MPFAPLVPVPPIAPVGHGPLNVKVNFNESPPVYYSNEFERDMLFSLSSLHSD